MEQVQHYVSRYRRAVNDAEKNAVLTDYQMFLADLGEGERLRARAIMREEMRPHLDATVARLDALQAQALAVLNGNVLAEQF